MRALVVVVALVALATATSAAAQSVRYRRPYDAGYRLNYGFDHSGGGDCVDYACGGTCYDGHTGSDLGAPFGTTVLAAADGTVTATNDGCANYGSFGNTCGGRCGNYVRIRHGDGSTSLYCHMQLGSIRVSPGQSVSCGQPIGLSASSGSSTGPHLHFGHISPGAGSASDPWAGGCSRATSVWVDQGGYRGPPSTACSGPSCVPSGESCNGRDEDCDGRIDEDLRRGCGTDVGECVSGTQGCASGGWGACEGAVDPVPERCDRRDEDCDGLTDEGQLCEHDEVAWGAPVYGTSHGASTDVDGDGTADACAALSTGIACYLSSAHGFGLASTGGGDLGSDLAHASSLRMGDLDGDGQDDACGIEGDRLVCRRSLGHALGPSVIGPAVALATSVELVEIDGDGQLDACIRDASGLACHLATGSGFGSVVTLGALSDAAGFADVVHHGSIRYGDLDGDGRGDVCARDAEGVDCWLGEGDHFGERVRGPRWSDAAGFAALGYWSTLRLADVDGDGRDDVCARTPSGFFCARSLGRTLGDLVPGPAMQSPRWDLPDGYATLRMGDVDGDGRADVCAREDERFRCWLSSGRALDRAIDGPALPDAAGFTDASLRYRTIRLADVDGDGRADVCARFAEGLRCAVSTGHGFDRQWLLPAWSDASELVEDARAASVRIGGVGYAAAPSQSLIGVFGCRASPASRPAGAWLALTLLACLVAYARTPRRALQLESADTSARLCGPSRPRAAPAPVRSLRGEHSSSSRAIQLADEEADDA